jgi:hypothetical protein
MRDEGITAVVNMREEADDAERGVSLDHYLWLPTTDVAAPTLEDLARGVAFVAAQHDAGRSVYIHCASGVGRAPTMAAAYLVHRGASPEEAWDAIRRTRPFIRPTPPQISVLQAFAASPLACAAAPSVDASPLRQREARAFESISSDPTLTNPLTDDAAHTLLCWARDEMHQRVARTTGMDDEAAWDVLRPQIRDLRRQTRDIARQSAGAERPKEAVRRLVREATSSPSSYDQASAANRSSRQDHADDEA